MSTTDSTSYELADYARMIWRSWWVVVVCAILGGLGGVGLASIRTKVYESAASVQLQHVQQDANPNGARTSSDINVDTEAQIVKSSSVLGKALELLKQNSSDAKTELDREAALAGQLNVTVPSNTTVLVITCDAESAADAQACAHAVGTAYVTNRQATAEAAVKTQVDNLQNQINDTTAQLQKLTGQAAPLPTNSADRAYLQVQIDGLKNNLNDLNTKKNDLTNTPVNGGSILVDAQRPTSPASPDLRLYLAFGVGVGLVIGLIAAVARERMDKRVRRGEDVPRRTDVPLLAELPRKVPVRADEVFATYGTGGRMFSRLRNEVVASVRSDHRVVVVSGASRGQVSTVVAGNLATAFARAGSDAILVCANMEDGNSITGMLGISGVPGLADVLAGRARLAETIQQAARQPGLRVVAAGGVATAAGLLQSEAMRTVVAELRKLCDYVILEAPSTSVSADAQSLAGLADAAILVVETERTELVEIADAAEQLHRIGTPVIGAVVLPRIRRGSSSGRGSSGPAVSTPAQAQAPDVERLATIATNPEPGVGGQPNRSNGARPAGLELPSASGDQTVVFPRITDGSRTNPTEGRR
jgi:capsular exopolysaccharide synthesis family protein